MRRVFYLCLIVASLSLVVSCTDRSDEQVYQHLAHLDSMIDSVPQQVVDSLELMNAANMSRPNRAYYHLLKVISDDKTYVNFTSDSMIVAVTDYYRTHDPKSRNHIRSLAYQGIVRTRMGVKDSTVYDPLREADGLLRSMPQPDPSLGYLVNYFLGNIHYNNRNYPTAHDYFRRTLDFAREENDSLHVFDTYLALYWNEMQQRKFTEGELYLDTVSSFYSLLPGKDYFILNAQSTYYDIVNEPEKALNREKELLRISHLQKENIDQSRLYFLISDRFVGLEQLDSAMLYAEKAIELIEDTTYIYSHIYYNNIASIAEKQGNYYLANEYQKRASELYKSSVNDRLDTQIAELEKKYDLTEIGRAH